MHPALLNFPQHIEQLRCFDGGDRTLTNRWEDVRLQTPEDLACVVGRPTAFPVFVPFARDRFKGIAGGDLGSPFALTGRVWPLPHHRVSLLVHDGPGQPWTTAEKRLSLTANGRFSTSIHPKQNKVYRLGLPAGAVSPRQSIAVGPALTLVRSGKAFRATIYPVLPGATLTLQRHRPGGWKAVAHATVGSGGHARFGVSGTKGRWRVSFGGDAQHAGSHSPTLTSPKLWQG